MGRISASPQAREQDEHFWTTEEVAERYRTSPATVRWWRQVGTYGPKGIKVGRRVLYSQAEIERFERDLGKETTAAPGHGSGVEGKLAGPLDAADRVTSHHQD